VIWFARKRNIHYSTTHHYISFIGQHESVLGYSAFSANWCQGIVAQIIGVLPWKGYRSPLSISQLLAGRMP